MHAEVGATMKYTYVFFSSYSMRWTIHCSAGARVGFKVFHAVVCSQLFCAVFLSWSLTLTLSISWIYYIPLFCVQQLVAWDKGCICKLSGTSPRYFWAIISSGFSLNRPSTRQLLSQIVITYRSLATWSPPERVLCIDYTSSGGQILHCCNSG